MYISFVTFPLICYSVNYSVIVNTIEVVSNFFIRFYFDIFWFNFSKKIFSYFLAFFNMSTFFIIFCFSFICRYFRASH